MTFSKATMRFLRGLAAHNKKPWFESHRAEYESDVLAPMQSLIEEMEMRLARLAPEIVGDPKRSMFRIYRDIRFSSDKSPYKTHASCWFYHRDGSRGVGREAEGGGAGFYFQIAPGDSFVGGGMWMPPKDALARIREAIAERPKAFKKIVDDPRLRRRFGAMDQRRPGTQTRAASLELEPAQVLEARPGARQWVGRLVVLHKPVLDAGLAGVREQPLPINSPLPHIRHDALGRFVGRGSPDHVFHVDQRKAARIAREVCQGVPAAERHPEDIELEMHQRRIGLCEQQVIRQSPVGERDEHVVVVMEGELEPCVSGGLPGLVQTIGDLVPVSGVAPLSLIDPGGDDELVTDEPGGVECGVPAVVGHLVLHVSRGCRQSTAFEYPPYGGRRVAEVPSELHFAIPDPRHRGEGPLEVPLQQVPNGVQLKPNAVDPGPGACGLGKPVRRVGQSGEGAHEGSAVHGGKLSR